MGTQETRRLVILSGPSSVGKSAQIVPAVPLEPASRITCKPTRGKPRRQSVKYLPPNTPSRSISFEVSCGRNCGARLRPAAWRKVAAPRLLRDAPQQATKDQHVR